MSDPNILNVIMTFSLSIVALSIPVLGFLLSQIAAKKGYSLEARLYKILSVFFTIFLIMGTIFSLLSYWIIVKFIPESLSVHIVNLFPILLISIPGIIGITVLLTLRG